VESTTSAPRDFLGGQRYAVLQGGPDVAAEGKPERVNVHDFPSQAEGKAIPYGAYEIGEDRAVVNVGVTHDTAEFAVKASVGGGSCLDA
jgi:hypothetical protein